MVLEDIVRSMKPDPCPHNVLYSVALVAKGLDSVRVYGETLASRGDSADQLKAASRGHSIDLNDVIPAYRNNRVVESNAQGFFAMQFPHIWVTGRGDITSKQGVANVKTIALQRYMAHVWWHYSGLVMTDRRARAATFDAVLRGARFRDANVFIRKHLSPEELKMTVGDVGGAALKKGMKGAGILRRFASMAYKEKGAMNYMRKYRRQSMAV